jgi:hypothetical protein
MKPLNKSDSTVAGSVSGCVLWLLVFSLFAACMVPVSLIFAVFTTDTPMMAGIVGPMFCTEGSKAQIRMEQTTMHDDNGFDRPAMGYTLICVDTNGKTVAEPAPWPTWTWNGLSFLAGLLVAALLALLFAAPLGVLVTRLLRR